MIKEGVAVVLIGLALPAAAQVQSEHELTSKLVVSPPALPDQPQDADAIVCRPPQQLPGQRPYGPKVCQPRRVWEDLHRQGLDIGADGQSVGESEKYRTFRRSPGAVGC
jgi:hypothetical protein